MPLVPDKPRGVWKNSGWKKGTAGTFATIIGISDYAYLKDGTGKNRPEQNYDLGQLPVSALTAVRFFEWVRDKDQFSGAPLAKCWLLLAPSKAEVQAYGGALPAAAKPTLQACTTAIRAWFAELQALSPEEAAKSRALMFFSGHGVEIVRDKQLLLPCDYLKPPAHVASEAMSTRNIADGMARLAVPNQFFFIDACRNDHEELRETQNLEGTPILDTKTTSSENPLLVGPVIYASGSGAVAWSPASPADGEGISYFGQALLEAFAAKADFHPECDQSLCRVRVFGLASFLQDRLPKLIPMRGTEATIGLGGHARQGVVTELALKGLRTATKRARGATAKGAAKARRAGRAAPPSEESLPGGAASMGDLAPPPPPPPPPRAAATTRAKPPLQTVALPSDDWRPADLGLAHTASVLQSEFVSALLTNARAIPLFGTGTPVPASLSVRKVERDVDRTAYLIDVTVPNGSHWLELVDSLTERTYACALPRDETSNPRFRLDLRTEIRDTFVVGTKTLHDVAVVTRMEAELSPENDEPRKSAAGLWDLYQALNVTGAMKSADLQRLEQHLHDKLISPLAALVAGIVLLRLREQERLHDWLENLANWFPDIPDGCVLRAEQLLQRDATAIEGDAVLGLVLRLNEQGLPFTSDAMGYLDRHVNLLLEAKKEPTAQQRKALESLRAKIDSALRYFRSGGLFSVFIGGSSAISPKLLARPR